MISQQLQILPAPAGRTQIRKPAQKRDRQTEADRAGIADSMRRLALSGNTVYGNLVPGSAKMLKIMAEADRLCNCAKLKTVFFCEKDLQYFGIPTGCKSRACERCNRKYVKPLFAAIAKRLSIEWSRRRKGWYFGLLTLTINRDRFNFEFPSQSQLVEAGRQVADFVRLFYGSRSADWDRFKRTGRVYPTKRFKGAGAVCVMEFSPSGFLHFHLLTYGPFVPQSVLSTSWQQITGDSYIVDFQSIKSVKHGTNYVLKYMRKMPDYNDYVDYAVMSVIQKGFRRLRCYGVFYNSIKVEKRKAMRLYCLYCGGSLIFSGVHDDPRSELIDWLQNKKYTDPDEGLYMQLPYCVMDKPSTNWIHKRNAVYN